MTTFVRRGAIIVSLFLVAVLTSGANLTEGIFYSPITREFGFSRTWGASFASTAHLINGIMLFFSGLLLKRIPTQYLQSVGFVILGSGYLLASLAHNYQTLLAGYSLVGLGLGTVALQVTSPVVINNWFDENKNLALASVYIGSSLGGATIVAVIGRIIVQEGWRTGYRLMSIPMFAMPLILLLFVRTAPPSAPEANQTDVPAEGMTIRQGLATPALWLLVAAFTFYMWVSAAIFFHFVPSLIEHGVEPATAAVRMSMLLLVAIPGKLLFGWLGDRIGVRRSLVSVLTVAAIALLLYAFEYNPATLTIFMVCFGLAYSAPIVLVPMALAALVGKRNLSVFAGIMMVISMIGWGAGPVLAGWLRDHLDSYGEVYLFLAAGLLASAILSAFALRTRCSVRQVGLNHAT